VVVLLVDALQPTTLLVSSCSPGLHVNREGLGQKMYRPTLRQQK
jgi:hypothetical protein